MAMAILELVARRPDWYSALTVALTRPPGVPERRAHEDPWRVGAVDRPRRVTDDLAWLRQAVDEPSGHGLEALDPALTSTWNAGADTEVVERLLRLEQRGELEAAGFALHEPDHSSPD
jgi:hypothetical protein